MIKILAGFYTHNKLRKKLLEESIKSYLKAASNPNIIPIVSSWDNIEGLKCKNIISKFKNNGHMNIILQLYSIIYSCTEEWDYFAFCEHDCLYPETYFTDAVNILETGKYTGITSENHIGLRPNGFCDLHSVPQPLSTMIVSKNEVLASLNKKFKECVVTGCCCIEPDDRSTWYIQKRSDEKIPVVHVNMDATMNNHHLTNHYDCYKQVAFATNIPYWGDYKQYGIFTDAEISQSVATVVDFTGFSVVDAVYGDVESGRTVSFMDAIKKLRRGSKIRSTNEHAGYDPAPGITKKVRVKILTGEIISYKDFPEHTDIIL
jgi:hypothetical protein